MKMVACVALLAAASVLAFGESSDKSSEETIMQLERDRQDAFARGDIEELDRGTAEAYSTINSSGRISDKPAMTSNLRAHRTKVLSVKLDELKARVYSDAAVLTGVYSDVAETDGVKKENHARFTRVFVKNRGKWIAVAYQQTAIPREWPTPAAISI